MSELARPFAALRPTAASASDFVAPPYDVVSTDEARAIAGRRPRSFLHISRPEIDLPEGSSPYSDEAYAQGARNLERLVAERVLVRENEPTYYIYRMEMGGHIQTGIAFVGSVRAYEQQAIPVHLLTKGRTNRAPKVDAFLDFTARRLLALPVLERERGK